jgi:lipoprotein-anchoring transpeptidase ErfK/SrfK
MSSMTRSRHSFVRAAGRAVSLVSVLSLSALTLVGCSGGNSSTSPASPPGTATSAKTPSGQDAATKDTEARSDPTPQTQVQSQVIETPPGVLSTTAGTSGNGLLNDYTPAAAEESTVLQATVPTVHIYDSPTVDGSSTTLSNPLPSGAPLTFLVDGQTSTRYKVLLPVKPNGSVGWLDPREVGIKKAHKYKIVVEISAHKITVTNGDSVVLSEKIAVGKGATPTPDGRYYIKELLKPPTADGPYGPYAYGLSGYSPVVQNFKGGDDTIGIHGTNEPALLGQDVSHGCIRMSNAGITTLAKILPLGTPVIVKA